MFFPVLEDLIDCVAGQTLLGGEGCEALAIVTTDALFRGAEPEMPVPIHDHRPHLIAGQPVRVREGSPVLPIVATDPVVSGPYPDVAFSILDNCGK